MEGLERYKELCVCETGTIDWKKLMAYKKAALRTVPDVHKMIFAFPTQTYMLSSLLTPLLAKSN